MHPDARLVLQSELEAVAELFDQFENSRSMTKRQAIVQEICRALTVQAQLEDEVLFPALKKALKDSALVPRAKAQQAILRALIDDVQGIDPDSDSYAQSVRVISQHVRQHVDEQARILPRSRSSKLVMDDLGSQLVSRKQELVAALADFGGWD